MARRRLQPPTGNDAVGTARRVRARGQAVGHGCEQLELALRQRCERIAASCAEHELRQELGAHLARMVDGLVEPAREASLPRAVAR